MTTTTRTRTPTPCATCGDGVFVATDVRGRAFAYRDARALVVAESLVLPVCTGCGEMRLSAADTDRLDDALEPVYIAHRAASSHRAATE